MFNFFKKDHNFVLNPVPVLKYRNKLVIDFDYDKNLECWYDLDAPLKNKWELFQNFYNWFFNDTSEWYEMETIDSITVFNRRNIKQISVGVYEVYE